MKICFCHSNEKDEINKQKKTFDKKNAIGRFILNADERKKNTLNCLLTLKANSVGRSRLPSLQNGTYDVIF